MFPNAPYFILHCPTLDNINNHQGRVLPVKITMNNYAKTTNSWRRALALNIKKFVISYRLPRVKIFSSFLSATYAELHVWRFLY